MAGGEPRLGRTATYMRYYDHVATRLSTEIDRLHDRIDNEYRVFSAGSVRKWSKFGLEQAEQFQTQRDWVNMSAADLPAPPVGAPRSDLVYLECWQQPVSAVEDSELFEVALGGPDTSERMRLMHRVHAFAGTGTGDCEQD